ncbi:hypothetical protein FA95DRAFT_1141132 [Auriscalpium vulgare]|uniref:Uncharacterized protein n=1 Tax=Auriscalpium vulgare TaxID=40419 RepID=A0ACB8RVB5_9AGAM|nr:hypothetical protein FA95DRAFT_1141132 [Auriscalpium vulgare]
MKCSLLHCLKQPRVDVAAAVAARIRASFSGNIGARPGPSAPPAAKITPKVKFGSAPIPRIWKWTGDLFAETQAGQAERVCKVKLSKPSDHKPSMLRLSICFDDMDSLRFKKLMPVSAAQALRPSFQPVAQFAQMGPEGPSDAIAFEKLLIYMESRRLMTFAPLLLENSPIAVLAVFPSSYQDICSEYDIPPDWQKSGFLVAALLPWVITGKKAKKLQLYRDPDTTERPSSLTDTSFTAELDDTPDALRHHKAAYMAIKMLNFPQELYEFMSRDRVYCIWDPPYDGPVDGLFGREITESNGLRSILLQCGAREGGPRSDVRVVFVHVGSLSKLHTLPALSQRLLRPALQFITYGTHHTVPPERWGIHEVYPLGGVVTFTPGVFQSNPGAVDELLRLIEGHPLWDAFLVPSAVAMVARQACGSDPVSEYERGNFVHADLLSRLADGQMSLLRKPPFGKGDPDAINEWVQWQFDTSVLDPGMILRRCLTTFTEQYADRPEAAWPGALMREIVDTVCALQIQPHMMDKFRRFVVVGTNVDLQSGIFKDTVEALCIKDFDFRDAFYTTDEMRFVKQFGS